ncbi:competence/damage-inducible protein A [Ectobacillus sp. JY-23]|uniref:competence/damage-inducible protein A n=1 Tax=Ectobacillus sp. JY-23 TaxID=2933872 RepID=UPI001FF28176|nr:competence/damage-inducible protein A [Ectobacillus sp. JY-23]UOY93605.1 competence/damage-inducible protein A [Ectobacillus sp. JY-23]
MHAEIIAVGTELLLGQILNTNAKFLSQKLASIGVNVYFQTVVGDNAERLSSAIAVAQQRADVLIFTGGLGPTKDDLTKETIANAAGVQLVYDKQAMDAITAYFARTGRTFTENNKKQALVLEGAVVFPNDFGMAPGMALATAGKLYVLLPGPPKEMIPMYERYVEPYLMRLGSRGNLYSRVLRFFGIGESQLEDVLQDIIDAQTNPTIAPLAAEGEVTLRLTAKATTEIEAHELLNKTEEQILERVGSFFYGYNNESLHTKVIDLLKVKGYTLSCAESLTGGMFAAKITDVPGVSSCFKGGIQCYDRSVKEQLLGIPSNMQVVSSQCAGLLAANVLTLLQSDVGISFTGVAGPEPLEHQTPGTVHIGVAIKGKQPETFSLKLGGNRTLVRERAVKYGLYYLLKRLEEC